MDTLYLLATGPIFWLACAVFLVGSAWRVLGFLSLASRKDKVIYTGFRPAWAARSILHFLLPLSITFRAEPLVMTMSYVLHLAVLLTALFAGGHGVLLDAAWNLAWPALPDVVSDVLAVMGLLALVFFAVRRVTNANLKPLTSSRDWLAWGLTAAPLLTGLLAHLQLGDPRLMTVAHVCAGNLLLLAAPFTKLSHMYLFFVSRAVTGSDFGKRNVGAW